MPIIHLKIRRKGKTHIQKEKRRERQNLSFLLSTEHSQLRILGINHVILIFKLIVIITEHQHDHKESSSLTKQEA